MQAFIEIMDKIAQIDDIVKRNKDFTSIIATLRSIPPQKSRQFLLFFNSSNIMLLLVMFD